MKACVGWMYRLMFSCPQQHLEVSGQLYVPYPLGKGPSTQWKGIG
jgi:hypothetical protein